MSHYLAVVNPTGGTGKTTTAHALAVAFAEYGKRTLLVDCTSNSSLTFLLGIENPRDTAYDLFQRNFFADSAILSTSERFSFLPSDPRITFLDKRELSLKQASENFRNALSRIDSPFDFVIMDTPSALSYTWMAALLLADFHLGVANSGLGSARGILQTREVAEKFKEEFGTKAHWLGTLPTMGSTGAIALELLGVDSALLAPSIPRANSVISAESSGKSVLNTDNSGSVALAYRELAYFLLEDIATKN